MMLGVALAVCANCGAGVAIRHSEPAGFEPFLLAQESGAGGAQGPSVEPHGAEGPGGQGPEPGAEPERGPIVEQQTREQAAGSGGEVTRDPRDSPSMERQSPIGGPTFGLNSSFGGLGLTPGQKGLEGSINFFGLNELRDMIKNPTDFAKGFSLLGVSPQLTMSDKGEVSIGVTLGGLIASFGGTFVVSPMDKFGNIKISATVFNASVEIERSRGEIAAEYARNFELTGYDWDKY